MKRSLLFIFIAVIIQSATLKSQNLIVNGDFESGKTGWSKSGGNGTFTVEDDGTGTNNIGIMVNSTSTGDISDVSLKPDAVTTPDYYSYHYMVKVKAAPTTSGETPNFLIKTQVLDNGSSVKYINGTIQGLTVDWQTFECYFEYLTSSWNELRPYFQCGAVAGDYNFDDYIVEVNKSIPNGDFEFSTDLNTSWVLNQTKGTVETTTDANGGSMALKATVAEAGAAFTVSSKSLLVAVDENTNYKVNFFSKSDAGNGLIKFAVEYHDNTNGVIKTDYFNGIQPGTTYTEISQSFTTPAGTKSIIIGFLMAEVVDVMYIDDVVLSLDNPTDVSNIDKDELKIYPNPAVDVVNIEGASVVKTVDITDLSGRTAISVSELSGNKIDVAGLQRGVYLMKVTTGKGTKVVKFVKK